MPIFLFPVERVTGPIGTANTALTVSSEPVPRAERKTLSAVYIVYSANVSLDATVTLNSALGSDWDVILGTLTFTAERYGVYLPERPIPLSTGDVIDVLSPAGGASITATAVILFNNDTPLQDGEGGYQIEPSMGAH